MSFYVYIHFNTINSKRYVGITRVTPKARWKKGKGYNHNIHLTKAFEVYGWDNFEHIVFEVETESEMWYLEKYLIAYYETTNPDKGYNHSIGGENGGYFGLNYGSKEYFSNYYYKNQKRLQEYQRLQYQKHKEKRYEYLKEWRKRNPEKLAAQQKRHHDKKKNIKLCAYI